MAIYHLSAKAISRSSGRSATAAAAYRAGVAIADERTGVVHDYRRRGGVDREHSPGVVLPAGAAATLADPSALWNAAEIAEKRKDACTAREYVLAIPHELSPAQGGELVLAFAQALAARHGIAVDARVHTPDKDGDQRNWHAHVLTTTRIAGPGGLGAKADIEKSGRNRKADLEATRELWEGLANAALDSTGSSARIDRRTLAAQGIDRQPTQHLGPEATAMERDGRASRIGDENRVVLLDASERFAVARELARLDVEVQEVEGQLIELAQERAKREQARQEAERHAKMTSRELAAEIERLRPPRVDDLVPRHPAVVQARKVRETASQVHQEAQAAHQAAKAWRQAHPWRARAHRAGLWRSQRIEELDAQASQAPALWQGYAQALQAEKQTLAEVRTEIESDQVATLRQVEALEQIRAERVTMEQAEQRVDAEISAALDAFTHTADWLDGGGSDVGLSPELKAQLDRYNDADDAERARTLESYRRQMQEHPELAQQLTAALSLDGPTRSSSGPDFGR